ITIVIAIFASGLVSLTLTPLMCARLLKPRGEGSKKTWMERVIGGIEKRVLALYGASLWWFLRHRWVSTIIWVICLAGPVLPFTFIRPPKERPPIEQVTGQMMGKLNSIPGVFTFLRPFPVLEISTGVTSQQQGQYAFAVSGANPDQVYDVSQKLMGKLMQYRGFLTVSSDFYNNTPNLDIGIRRDQAKTYGVSEARILTMLRNAYSQNYLYLIKK